MYAEYLRLLLSRVREPALSWPDRSRARLKVMSIWSLHLISPSLGGLRDLRYHLGLVRHTDAVALAYLPWALVTRVARVIDKLLGGRSPAAGV